MSLQPTLADCDEELPQTLLTPEEHCECFFALSFIRAEGAFVKDPVSEAAQFLKVAR